ncbi:MAG: transposase [Bacteroidia bacterium]
MKYNNQFKMDVAIQVIQSKQSVSVVAKQYGIHPSTLYRFMNTNFEEIINRLDYLKYLKRMDRRDKKIESNQPLQEVSEIPTKKDTTIEITFLKSKKPLEKIKEESQVTIHFKYTGSMWGTKVRIWKSTFLHAKGSSHRSSLVHVENISVHPTWTHVSAGETINFTLIFSGLPKDCEYFDLIEDIPEPGGFIINDIKRNNSDVYHFTML